MKNETETQSHDEKITIDEKTDNKVVGFEQFNFNKSLLDSINKIGFKEPSPIQKDAIPIVLNKHDVVAQAQTGTGKTAAFGLPVINMMTGNDGIEMLVIVPTRELATQVSDELFRFSKRQNMNTATVYGGASYNMQIKHVESASILVATPGRLLDLLKKSLIKISPKFVVLDEADEMLDMGFLDDINDIFKFIPKDRQTLLFSATMPKPIKILAEKILKEPKFITITQKELTNTKIEQMYYVVENNERDDALMRLFDYKNPNKSIVFCKTKKDVDRLATYLVSQGYSAKGLHGDMEQRQREEVIRSFKGNTIETLVATDVAARGLDISDVTHVFNYQIPYESESYVHRIGRTGRAGKDGIAISIITASEFRSLKKIEKDVNAKMEAKIIPTIDEVRNKNQNKLIAKVKKQKFDDKIVELVQNLSVDSDLETVAHKLAAILVNSTKVKGMNKIGKSEKDIQFLITKYENNDFGSDRPRRSSRGRFGGGGRGRSGGGNGGGRSSHSRNRSGGGDRNGGGERSGGNGGGNRRSSNSRSR